MRFEIGARLTVNGRKGEIINFADTWEFVVEWDDGEVTVITDEEPGLLIDC
jgi:hypothetical protein